jgi:hypothetical protein
MTTESRFKPFIFKLDTASNKKLNEIALAMSQETGMPVSRAAALRRLISAFNLPADPASQTIHANTERTAA